MLDVAGWDRLARAGGRVPLQQSAVYGQALAAGGRRVARLPIGEEQGVQVVERSWAGIRVVLASRGPIGAGTHRAEHPEEIFRAIRAHFGRCLLLWSPQHLGPQMEACRPVVTGYGTVWVRLPPDPQELRLALDGKWRNQLRRAEKQRLAVREVHRGPSVEWLAARHEEHRQAKGYRALPVTFLQRMAELSPGCRERLVLIAELEGLPVAGIWLQVHHGSATYLIGYASEAGRRSDAMRLLLWRGMLALQRQGIGWLDLGGIATDCAPGLSRFKLGLGGAVTIEAGTYLRPLLR